jgi:hypothetical protein
MIVNATKESYVESNVVYENRTVGGAKSEHINDRRLCNERDGGGYELYELVHNTQPSHV